MIGIVEGSAMPFFGFTGNYNNYPMHQKNAPLRRRMVLKRVAFFDISVTIKSDAKTMPCL